MSHNRSNDRPLNISALGTRLGRKLAITAIRGALTLVALSAVIVVAHPARAQTETVLYSFRGQPGDGSWPVANLVLDKKGNLYGTTYYGGTNDAGTVFKLTPSGAESVLYSLGSQPGDGSGPEAGLALDKNGNLYGTTWQGGAYGQGTVFRLTPTGAETVLHSFGSQPGDGFKPHGNLVFDKNGNLYGTTQEGGWNGGGTAFMLTPTSEETVLHSFGSQSGDGNDLTTDLVWDKGNLYGTTQFGGAYGQGTVFRLTPTGAETVLYSFGSQPGDGFNPDGNLVFDKNGNLYGTTEVGGANNAGTVFKLTPSGAESVLYSFGSQSGDGGDPRGLVLDKKGILYGSTYGGGASYGGTVFELTGTGAETVLYSLGSRSGDGVDPAAGLVSDRKDNLYGTTQFGGANNAGTVFKLIP